MDALKKTDGDKEGIKMIETIKNQAKKVAELVVQNSKIKKGEILVVGCSSSEISGGKIGAQSSPEIGSAVLDSIYSVTSNLGIYLAAQCCEHLNRALIIEYEAAQKYGLEIVNVIPQPKAGGSFATAAYKKFSNPVAVEKIQAHAGIDIGNTLIGMHLRPVAVPLRIEQLLIGKANVVCARTRPKFIGGARAAYDQDVL